MCRPLSLEMRISLLEVNVYACQYFPHLLKSVDSSLPVLAIFVTVSQWWGFSCFRPYRNDTTWDTFASETSLRSSNSVFMLKFLLDYFFTSGKCLKFISIKYLIVFLCVLSEALIF